MIDKALTQFLFDKKVRDAVGFFIKLKRFPFYIKNKKIFRTNEKLKSIKKSERCFILGSGPSLKDVDLTKLNGDLFATNLFYKFKQADDIKPLLYLMVDPNFNTGANVIDLQNALKKYPNTIFVLNGKYLDTSVAPKTKVYWWCGWSGDTIGKKKLDMTKVMPATSNVVCTAITVALYMGYSEIVLLGCDFNSFASQKAVHCYDEKDDKRAIDLYFELYCYAFVAKQHMELCEYAKRKGVSIINATKGSLIDAYPKKELEELIRASSN